VSLEDERAADAADHERFLAEHEQRETERAAGREREDQYERPRYWL